ncbi:MAG: anhydro-N-acetylmuramic acid kinase [Gammaproteobacteria bacterium]|nr:MAG: anhydro-N-acetylmuramic acid kinase [Gammaproteobacteria bacterium]
MTAKLSSGLYIGLMSGTSIDGIDAALVQIDQQAIKLVHHYQHAYQPALKEQLIELCNSEQYSIQRLGELNRTIGEVFAEAVLALLDTSTHQASDIVAIGSHGQTIFHHPNSEHAFSLQIGDPNTIAHRTQITTIADFRNKDMVVGGQGAPLVPRFHQHIVANNDANRIIINIGGISNITVLGTPQNNACSGFDTGPGNTLLDAWIQKHLGKPYDHNGIWSESGTVNQALLDQMMADPYFSAQAPKSTGREYFNLKWLDQHLDHVPNISHEDVQRTLISLTAQTIYQGILSVGINDGEVYLCGGGCHNAALVHEIARTFNGFSVDTTQTLGVDPDWMEAMAFAWFASRTLASLPSNLPSATGATKEVILGGIYYA